MPRRGMIFQLDSVARQGRSLERVEHRPWPLPAGRWVMGQTRENVLFAHWRVPAEEIRRHVPDALEVETHDGSAWLGIVASRVTALRARGMLPVPGLSSFLELDVRTYVRAADGKPGIWLLSVDASSGFAVRAGRRGYRLPCFQARMTLDRAGEWRDVECARSGERGRVFSGRYRVAGEAFQARPGSLESFLAERYCVYAASDAGKLYRAEIHHAPWPLQPTEAEIELTSIAPLELRGEPLCHASERQDVVVWPPEPVPSIRG